MQSSRPAVIDKITHYNVLEIPKTASEADIIKAFRKAILQWHSDHAREWMSADDFKLYADEMFRRVTEARDTLLDPERRKYYDQNPLSNSLPAVLPEDISFAENWNRLNNLYIEHLAKDKKSAAKRAAKLAYRNANLQPTQQEEKKPSQPEEMEASPASSPAMIFSFFMFSRQNIHNDLFIKINTDGLLAIRKEVAKFKGRGVWFINISLMFDNHENAEKFVSAWNKMARKIPDSLEFIVFDNLSERGPRAIVAPINLGATRRFSASSKTLGEELLQELNKYANISDGVDQVFWWRMDKYGVSRKVYESEMPKVHAETRFKFG